MPFPLTSYFLLLTVFQIHLFSHSNKTNHFTSISWDKLTRKKYPISSNINPDSKSDDQVIRESRGGVALVMLPQASVHMWSRLFVSVIWYFSWICKKYLYGFVNIVQASWILEILETPPVSKMEIFRCLRHHEGRDVHTPPFERSELLVNNKYFIIPDSLA